jgi:hypothetical protein
MHTGAKGCGDGCFRRSNVVFLLLRSQREGNAPMKPKALNTMTKRCAALFGVAVAHRIWSLWFRPGAMAMT